MSTIALWINNYESRSLWAVSDTRYSSGQESNRILTDFGPKIYELQVICKESDNSGLFNRIYWDQKIGIAFAGSALVALIVTTNLNKILTSLISVNKKVPCIEEIHNLVTRIVKQYTTPIVNNYPVEFSSFGYCKKNNDYKIYRTQIGKDNRELSEDVTKKCENDFILLGAHKDDIKQRIQKFKKESSHPILSSRAPYHVISKIVEEGTYSSIGGGLQLGITIGKDFELYSICEPIVLGESKASLKFTNIDLFEEIKTVDECSVNIKGMS